MSTLQWTDLAVDLDGKERDKRVFVACLKMRSKNMGLIPSAPYN